MNKSTVEFNRDGTVVCDGGDRLQYGVVGSVVIIVDRTNAVWGRFEYDGNTLKPLTNSPSHIAYYSEAKISKMKAEYADQARAAQETVAKTIGLPVKKTLVRSGIVLRLIPAGTFMMGSSVGEEGRSSDEIQHEVIISKPFYIGKYEVTQGQWKTVMGGNPAEYVNAGNNAPVDQVDWHDCTNFAMRLCRLENLPDNTLRLPSEAEWEYACRAGADDRFSSGDSTTDLARAGWYIENSASIVHVVGKKSPNNWGLFDMHGNVHEWCSDWYGPYEAATKSDPRGSADGTRRVMRGGSWIDDAWACRSANRGNDTPNIRYGNVGLRVVCAAAAWTTDQRRTNLTTDACATCDPVSP